MGEDGPYQLPTSILIVGREPSFQCAASPRQLHDGSVKVLFGAQQCAAYIISSFDLRRVVVRSAFCGAICCMPVAWPEVPPGDTLGSFRSGRTTSVRLLCTVQRALSSASTVAVSACNRAISACSQSRLLESSEHAATLVPAGLGVAFAATETERKETVTRRTQKTAHTESQIARAVFDPGPSPHPRPYTRSAPCRSSS